MRYIWAFEFMIPAMIAEYCLCVVLRDVMLYRTGDWKNTSQYLKRTDAFQQ